MQLEEQRYLHEDIERLEKAISDRILDEPVIPREALRNDHQLAQFLDRIEAQSKKLLRLYDDPDRSWETEVSALRTGDNFDPFYAELAEIKTFHRRYPNEPVENLEVAYRKSGPGAGAAAGTASDISTMFTGEEGFGKFLDLTTHHDRYLNLPGVKGLRKTSYLHYLDLFDSFVPPACSTKRHDKVKDLYRQYVHGLAEYLQSFYRRTRPLENIEKLLLGWEADFSAAWKDRSLPGWGSAGHSGSDAMADVSTTAAPASPSADPLWCSACQKRFSNQNLYDHHLNGKKHKRAAQEAASSEQQHQPAPSSLSAPAAASIDKEEQERAVARSEFFVQKLARCMVSVRDDTKTNVERKQALTDRERQQELAQLQAEMADAAAAAASREANLDGEGDAAAGAAGNDDSDDDERVYNPLKLPLAWDGKPIPYWLYKLHGLGVEFPCEICGNFVYKGRRDFDKHFNEGRHIYGLKCLGIASDAALFREVTRIEDALKLHEKIVKNKKAQKKADDGVVQMEDAEGNVMPEKVYYDLQKQGLL